MFYAHMIAQDEREKIERTRDSIEYMARFIDNESVEKIQRMRENQTETEDDSFNALLEDRFGRSI